MELLVDSSLQVLIKQRLQLFILLVEQTSLFNQVLPINEHLVVFGQSLIKCFPDRPLLLVENSRHPLPVELLLLLLSGCVTGLVLGFRRLLLICFAHILDTFLHRLIFTILVEFLKCCNEKS